MYTRKDEASQCTELVATAQQHWVPLTPRRVPTLCTYVQLLLTMLLLLMLLPFASVANLLTNYSTS
jgi:hypothetical protein